MSVVVGVIPQILYLLDAYERVYRAMNPHYRQLQARLDNPGTCKSWDEHDYSELCANEVLRNAIEDGSLTPLVHRKGKPRQLPRKGWKIPGQFPRQDWMPNCFPQTGIYSNFVGPNDPTNPGPPTGKNGKLREVFFNRNEFDCWLRSVFPHVDTAVEVVPVLEKMVPSPRRGGKKKGDGSYKNVDAPLQREMKSLIQQGKATSVRAAARLVVGNAHGAGTEASKVDRLAKGYHSETH
jgi:hypothetical protein